MKAIQDYIYAIRITGKLCTNSIILRYLLPALLTGICFWGLHLFLENLSSSSNSLTTIPLVGNLIQQFFIWILESLKSAGSIVVKFILLTLFSPINCLLSAKTDSLLTKSYFKTSIEFFLKDIARASIIIFISFILYGLSILIWIILAKVIGLNFINPVIFFCISSFYLGLSFFDYSLERYRKGISTTFDFGFKNSFTVLLTGIIFSLICMIPSVGIIFAPFLITIISTIIYLKRENKLPFDQTNNIIQQ